jgi:biotin carboxyl carrier protein
MGQRLITLEAMKMENNIDSDKEGTVISIKVTQGQSVMEGEELIEIGG